MSEPKPFCRTCSRRAKWQMWDRHLGHFLPVCGQHFHRMLGRRPTLSDLYRAPMPSAAPQSSSALLDRPQP